MIICSFVLQVHWDVCVQRVYPVRHRCADIISDERAAGRLVFHRVCLYNYLHFYHPVPCVHTQGIYVLSFRYYWNYNQKFICRCV